MRIDKLLRHSIPSFQTQRKIIKMKERSTLFSNMKPQIYSLMNKEGMSILEMIQEKQFYIMR